MSFQIHVHDRVADIGREAWDACASLSGDPFLSFDFLDACEASGSAVLQQGWAGRHLSLADETGRVLGVMPLWLKGHSQGEYVFDHSWAVACLALIPISEPTRLRRNPYAVFCLKKKNLSTLMMTFHVTFRAR